MYFTKFTMALIEGSRSLVIPPLIMVLSGRISYAASFNFCIGVIPPIAILGRSLL
jgi:hypothetical protein